MKKKEDLTIDNLLSWDDVIQLGSSINKNAIFVGRKHLYECITKSSDKYNIDNDFDKYIIDIFRKEFPSLLLSAHKYDIRFKFVRDEDGKWHIKYSIPHIITSMLKDYDILDMPKEYYQELCKKFLTLPKEEILERSKKVLVGQKMGINALISNYDEKHAKEKDYTKNDLLDFRAVIMARIKNLEALYDYFDRDFPIEVLKYVNKDNYLLFITSIIFSTPAIQQYVNNLITYQELLEKVPEQELSSIVNFLNNYILVTEYISSENDKEYINDYRYSFDKKSNKISSTDAIKVFEDFINRVIKEGNFDKKEGFFTSYEELLSVKASNTWKKIQNTKLVESIKVSFEMISSGTNINTLTRVRKPVEVLPLSEKRQAKIKRDYDLLDQKLDYYGSKTPVIELRGINNFVGYFAQFYQNGVVVLDKYYKYGKDRRGNEKVVPASDEAIYFMNSKEFADLCRYTKPELIEEKKFNNPDIDRKYHKGKWQQRVDSIINGKGYGELDLDFLNQLIKALGAEESSKEKVLK